MERRYMLADVKVKATVSQREGLVYAARRLGLSWEAIRARVVAAAQDGAAREIARLTTQGPESPEDRQQRCNACRQARAEECAACEVCG